MKSQASLSSRQALIAVSLAASLASVITTTSASAQSPSVFRSIRVDMSGIPAGARQTRDDLQVCLSLNLPKAFAGRINPAAQGAPVLVVRPTAIWLASITSFPSSDDFGGNDSTGFDSMDGEAIIGSRRIPLTVSASAPAGATALPVELARMRAINLCNSFVGWLARKI